MNPGVHLQHFNYMQSPGFPCSNHSYPQLINLVKHGSRPRGGSKPNPTIASKYCPPPKKKRILKLDQPKSDRDILPPTSYIRPKCPLPLPTIEARLRSAWKTARYYNSGLAVELDRHYMTYGVPSLEEIKPWL